MSRPEVMIDTRDRPIIVGVDGSAASVEALVQASTIAAAFDAPLEAITTWNNPVMLAPFESSPDRSPEEEAQRLLDDAVREAFQGNPPRRFRAVTIPGPPTEVLLEQSDRAAMLVVGGRGRGAFKNMMLGSVSAACTAHAHCPVLVVHAPSAPSA